MAGETTSKTWTYDKDNKKFQEQNPDVPPVVDDEQQKAKLEQEARDKRLYGQNRQIINLNSSRYRGLGKSRRLKRDINRYGGQAFIWDGAKTTLSGEANPDGYSWSEARNLLKKQKSGYQYDPNISYDSTTAEGLFNQKVANYFNKNQRAAQATWQAGTNKPKTVRNRFFSGFGDQKDQWLNELYAQTPDKAKYKSMMEKADTNNDGSLSPDELNEYGKTWFANSRFNVNGQIDPMDYLFQRQMGNTDDVLRSQSGYYNMPVWYNWDQSRARFNPSEAWSKYDESKDGDDNLYIDNQNVYKDFLKSQYNLNDAQIQSIFGNDYKSALGRIGYTPQQGHENYFDNRVASAFDRYLMNNVYHGAGWNFQNGQWQYTIPSQRRGGRICKAEYGIYFGNLRQRTPPPATEENSGQQPPAQPAQPEQQPEPQQEAIPTVVLHKTNELKGDKYSSRADDAYNDSNFAFNMGPHFKIGATSLPKRGQSKWRSADYAGFTSWDDKKSWFSDSPEELQIGESGFRPISVKDSKNMDFHFSNKPREEYNNPDSSFAGVRSYVTFQQNGKTYMMPVKNKGQNWYYNPNYVYDENGNVVQLITK